MITNINRFILTLLQNLARRRDYPWWTGVMGIACSVMAIPFVPVLIAAVLLSPQQWRSIAIFSSMGSALGGLVVLQLFHYLGWLQVMNNHPEWFDTQIWQMTLSWLANWGVLALAAIAATPLPQSPALFFLAMTEQPWFEIWLALATGKLVKYGMVAYISCHFPNKLKRLAIHDETATTGRDKP